MPRVELPPETKQQIIGMVLETVNNRLDSASQVSEARLNTIRLEGEDVATILVLEGNQVEKLEQFLSSQLPAYHKASM